MRQQTEISSPLNLGFAMPAEWEMHEATWLAWPHEVSDWPGKFELIPWVFAEIIRHLSRVEQVYLLVDDDQEAASAKSILQRAGANMQSVRIFKVPTDRGWMRDSGPTCVKTADGEVAYLNWLFNGWAKYDNHKNDAATVGEVNAQLKYRLWQPEYNGRRIVLEGGSIEVNGSGTVLTTEECLLSTVQERNPGFTKADYEAIFRTYLNTTNVVWLDKGIAGDDTHGHIDDLTRFVNPTTVVTVVEDDPRDENFAPLKENLERLLLAKDQDGKSLRVETLPMPAPLVFDGERLPASYANFYIANKMVLVPTFNDPKDRVALQIIATLFPGREVIGIYCRDLVEGQGTLHCLAQQQPTGSKRA